MTSLSFAPTLRRTLRSTLRSPLLSAWILTPDRGPHRPRARRRGRASEATVGRAVRRLREEGHVVPVDGARPCRWELASGEEHACVSAGPSAGLRVELSARTSGSHVRFVSTGTHSWSRTNRTDKFFPIGCPLVRKRRFSWISGSPRPRAPRASGRPADRAPNPALSVHVTAKPAHSLGWQLERDSSPKGRDSNLQGFDPPRDIAHSGPPSSWRAAPPPNRAARLAWISTEGNLPDISRPPRG
jgi:hypothetical protein